MAKWKLDNGLPWDARGDQIGLNKSKKRDMVNNPIHYATGEIECIDYIQDFLTEEEYIGYLRGNIAKYLHRWRYKNGLEDLKKSEWYGARLIKLMENK